MRQFFKIRHFAPAGAATVVRRTMGLFLLSGVLIAGAQTLSAQAIPGLAPPLRGELPQVPAPIYMPEPEGMQVSVVATGLDVVWSLQFAPDGRLFIAERPGRVRVMGTDGVLDPTPWIEFPRVYRMEDGLLGMTLHPDFENEPWVYVYNTIQKGDQLVNRVSRFREVNGRAGPEEVLIDDIASHRIHNGGRLRFGPDGMLYITVGELNEPTRSQDMNDLHGKVLRLTPDGKIPEDNPFPGSPIWAYGVRNPHGLAFRPSDGTLFLADNGPTGEWGQLRIGQRDEISPVPKGGNLGWPLAVGAPGHPDYVDPVIAWIPSQPPGDLTFYDADLFPDLKGSLLYTTLGGQVFMRLTLGNAQNPNAVTRQEWWFHTGAQGGSTYGRLRALTVGPDGAIYFGTSNAGRPNAREGDDRVLKITPAPAAAGN